MTTTPDGRLRVSAVDHGCAVVGSHLLEVVRDGDDVCGWTLRCSGCLTEVAGSRLARVPDLPGLPIGAALAVGAGTGDDVGPAAAFSVALGRIAPDCDHRPGARGRPAPPARPAPAPRGQAPVGVEFRAGLVPGVGVRRADPVVMPGGWWVAAVRGAARSVTSQAFGIRHRAWARSVELTACPEHPCPAGTRSLP